jgi:hypothetical protein
MLIPLSQLKTEYQAICQQEWVAFDPASGSYLVPYGNKPGWYLLHAMGREILVGVSGRSAEEVVEKLNRGWS